MAFLEPFAADFGLDSTFERAFGTGVFASVATGALPTLRYVQRVPGTEVQVFDGELLVGLSADRRLEYVKPRIVRHLSGFSTVPAIGAERAAQIVATQVGASDMEDSAPVLGVFAANVEEPLLAWRLPGAVDGRTVLVTVDALTGSILEVRPIGSGAVEAYSAERFYASGTDANGAPLGRRDPRHRPDARLPVDVARPPLPFLPQASLWSVTSGLVISVQDKLGVPVLATHIQDDLYAADVGNDPKLSNGIGVNAQYNLKQAAAFFDARFGHKGWAVPLVVARVHADAPGEGHFDGGTGVITLGDGIRPGPNDPYKTYSPATSLDYVTHEYAHGVIAQLTRAPTRYAYGLGTSGEPGAINEGLADIFAATADMNATKSLSNAFKTAARRSVRDGDLLPYERRRTKLSRHRRRKGQPRVLPLSAIRRTVKRALLGHEARREGFLFLALVACAALAQALPAPPTSELMPERKLSGATQDYILTTFPPAPFPSPELGEDRACRVLAELPSLLREWRALSAAESHLTVEDHQNRVHVTQIRTDGNALRIRASTKVGPFVFDNGYDSVRVASRAGEVARLDDGTASYADARYLRWEIVPVLPEWPLLFRSEAEAWDALNRMRKERVPRIGFVFYRGLPIVAEFPLVPGGRANVEMIDGKEAFALVEHDALEDLVVPPVCTIVCPGLSSKTVVAFRSWDYLNRCPLPTWAQPVLHRPMR